MLIEDDVNQQKSIIMEKKWSEEHFYLLLTVLVNFVNEWSSRELPMVRREEGIIIGGEEFYHKHTNRRKIDTCCEPLEKIFIEFNDKNIP